MKMMSISSPKNMKKGLTLIGLLLFMAIFPILVMSDEIPKIFDFNTFSGNPNPAGVTPIPHPEYYLTQAQAEAVFDDQYALNPPGNIGFLLKNGTNPINGWYSSEVTDNMMNYCSSNGYTLNFVFADFEYASYGAPYNFTVTEEDCLQYTTSMVNHVRDYDDPKISNAYVGNYGYCPADSSYWDWTVASGSTMYRMRQRGYLESGVNAAMPCLYSTANFKYHYTYGDAGERFYGNACVSVPHAVNWAPLERLSSTIRVMQADQQSYSGDLVIPFVTGYLNYPSTIEPTDYVKTQNDSRALLQHFRLRGIDGYYTYWDANCTNYGSAAALRDDMYPNAWQPLDWFFRLPGPNSILNTDTNKTGGVEWSGIRRGNQCLFIFSNYTNSSTAVNLPSSIENLPATTPSIAAAGNPATQTEGQHLLMRYVVGPLAWWKMNENTGGTTADAMEGAHTATLYSSTWTTGVSGSALNFSPNQYARVADSDRLDLSKEISIDLWFYPTAYNNGYNAYLAVKSYSTSDTNFYMYFFGETSGDTYKRRILVKAKAGGSWTAVSPLSSVIVLNKWNHVVWTYSSANGGMLYLNNVSQGNPVGSGDLSTNAQPIDFGYGLTGKMDEVKIYSSVLTAQEVLESYSCVLNTRFDERTGSTSADDSTYANSVSFSGTPPTWCDGKVGGALSFSPNQYVTVTDSNSLDLANEISTECWIYPTAYNSGYNGCLAVKSYSTSDSNYYTYFFGETADASLKHRILVKAKAGGSWQSVSPLSAVIDLNKWTHVVWTYSSASGGKLYINGVSQGNAVGSGALNTNASAVDFGYGLTGKIDEVKIFKNVLTADEVTARYNMQK